MPQCCDECRIQLSAYADGVLTLDEDRAVHAHLVACPACAAELADLMAVIHAIATLPCVPVRPDAWEAVAFRLRREGLIRMHWSRRTRWVAAVLVGGGALAIGWTMLFPPVPTRMADVDTFWREHATFSMESEPVMTGAPAVRVIEATYQMQGDLP